MPVVLTLQYLHSNMPQEYLAYFYGIHQSNVSRIIHRIQRLIEQELDDHELQPEELTGSAYPLDGTLIPTGNRSGQRKLYSGKHHKQGMNTQVVTNLNGKLLATSHPVPGSTHDVTAFRKSTFYEEC